MSGIGFSVFVVEVSSFFIGAGVTSGAPVVGSILILTAAVGGTDSSAPGSSLIGANGTVPDGIPFSVVNQMMGNKDISKLINLCYRTVGLKETVIFADQLMYMGYEYSTRSGSSIGVEDFVIPQEKAAIIDEAETEILYTRSHFRMR